MPDPLPTQEHRRIRNVDQILKENQELYDELYYKLDDMSTMLRVGKTATSMKLLVHYFPPELAEIALHLGKEPKRAEQVAEESGKPLEYVKQMLERYWLAGYSEYTRKEVEEKGYVLANGYGRILLEWPWCDGVGGTYKLWDEDEEKEAALLASKIHFEEGHLYEFGKMRVPGPMILVDERQVLEPGSMEDWEKGSQHILAQKNVGITRCGCRVRHGIYNHCKWMVEKPMIDVCLQFGLLIETYFDRGAVNRASHADCLDVLWYGLDNGLVSTSASTSVLPIDRDYICQCCSDCCHLIAPHGRLGITGAGAHRSNFDPRTDLKKCTAGDCGGDAPCIKACPIPNVRFYHPPTKRDKSDEFIGVDIRRCWGCGLCAGACPEKAIKMVKARNWVPATREAMLKAGLHDFITTPPAL